MLSKRKRAFLPSAYDQSAFQEILVMVKDKHERNSLSLIFSDTFYETEPRVTKSVREALLTVLIL
jgi:hypothetical protein